MNDPDDLAEEQFLAAPLGSGQLVVALGNMRLTYERKQSASC
ncbi:hypothetical protein [Kribbella endophytica]